MDVVLFKNHGNLWVMVCPHEFGRVVSKCLIELAELESNSMPSHIAIEHPGTTCEMQMTVYGFTWVIQKPQFSDHVGSHSP